MAHPRETGGVHIDLEDDPMPTDPTLADFLAQLAVLAMLLTGIYLRRDIAGMMDGNVERLAREERQALDAMEARILRATMQSRRVA
jgi:hypothetical protein